MHPSQYAIDEVLSSGPVIPVIVIEDISDAVPLARALVAGGVRVLEVTLRTAAAIDSIRAIANAVPEALVGAGTLIDDADIRRAQAAGARFGVSPGATPSLLAAATQAGFPLLPGVMTPSDVIAAMNAGYTALKLFPAAQAGGIGMLKALNGPFPQIRFCPTGGISPQSAPDFLALPNVACVGGSWLTPPDLIEARDWDGITRLAQQSLQLRK
ncbi:MULTISPECIES: bifunctional 4-hydroxy-2-oxoglutarate aldolase/2-dehydro-3-deoxy-phosphogluconate aldolase [Hydrocarboniphaga]|jgi:2-dehydro-3-deoxyphosphogluconate aldolase/(4S)-4-hydroxy-2-oxoglutarate aldolase|uniref:2-dehydro-3-deoxy-phosphogluconate aldolase n=1 Tax=Hydrocarboniphaga effusa AP103 TaxID=1172194 RepID=I7ZK51_9GAMM|nr:MULTISPECIES: bifunctional 4-hydroxy-2-oxoglutarate aldolase/2-dehydro-3-deoxy-phosphogluconate aldolase [Hydrocarboniphaga]EIT72137.1 2-keto-4-hydroxyglutarate aldolase/-keto-3-deoxy-6-phosphogluconate aldolase [Hydrocarboniphaga effusa AP103]MDZ4079722.1 bifunctional 4-hydroxy-2-oxoglutarate aldolase/2-dehydro-3-deoxy-phosphogluconate aldolase [Hydrocarboniphaga sp.]